MNCSSIDSAVTPHKPVILTFVRYYLPGYKSGGPVRTIANMVEALGDEFEFRIVTADRDKFDVSSYPGIDIGKWNRVGKAWVYYTPEKEAKFLKWKDLIAHTRHDVVYFNSFYAPLYTLLPLLAIKLLQASKKPLVIAPRGEFSPAAINIKRWRKKPFIFLARLLDIFHNVLWHASTEAEADLIRLNTGASSNIAIAVDVPANIASPDKNVSRPPRYNRAFRIVFLSRISRMKNLHYALKVLSKARIKLLFDIWGTQEDDDHWNMCQELIQAMPENVEVRYCGEASPAEVVGLLAGYDLFFLPTLGENYGHAIAEAVSAGTPVLISDRTPWRGLEAAGVGWDLPLDEDGLAFVRAIQLAKEKCDSEGDQWREQVRQYAEVRLHDQSIVESNREVFFRAMKISKS